MVKDLRVLKKRYWEFKWGTLHFDHFKDAASGYATYFRIHSLNIHRGKPSDFDDGERHFVCELEIL